MDFNWSLKEIYPGFGSTEFTTDIKNLSKVIDEINNWANIVVQNEENTVKKLEEYISKITELTELEMRLTMYINLSLSVNTQDRNALKYSDIVENKMTEIVSAKTKLERWISNIKDIDKCINSSSLLKEHEFYIKEITNNSKHLLSESEETIISKMKNTGSSAWIKFKDNLVSNMQVQFRGERLPLTVILNKAYDEDKDVRKEAYEAEIASYKNVEDGIAATLNAIKGEVLNVCDLRKYESPLEMTLQISRMKKNELDAMFTAIKESLPIFRQYLRRKAKMIGHKNGLPFYDLYAPVSKADMKFTYEEAMKFVYENFKTFSDDLASFAKKAFDNSWIDVKPREGKVGGAFCENLHFIGESRFLLNYGGSFGDVVTLAHELGHGFHGECLKNESILNSDYPMPIAETASTFCETIIKKAAMKKANKEEALAILEAEISDATQVIVDIYSRFLFEDALFEKRKEGALSVEEINNLMLNAQKEAYGDGLDPKYLHKYMWTWKPHYYDADINYYNFPYAFGLLFAKGLYAEYQKRGSDFCKDYEKLLSITGKNNLSDVAKSMGIDIGSVDFWRSSIEIVKEDVEEFMKLSNNI